MYWNHSHIWRRIWLLGLCCLAMALVACDSEENMRVPIWRDGSSFDLSIELPPNASLDRAVYTRYEILRAGRVWLQNSTVTPMKVTILVSDELREWTSRPVGTVKLGAGTANALVLKEEYLTEDGQSNEWTLGIAGDEGAGFYPIRFSRE